jgi:DNA-binding CsgD family transcriptional regulator
VAIARQTGKVTQQRCPVVVGREMELHALDQALSEAMTGHGRCTLLVGEPGIGKSRLAREVTGWAAELGVAVATGRAVPTSVSAAYRPITEALLQLLRHRAIPDEPSLQPWLPLLQPLLPALVEPSAVAEAPPSLRGEAVLRLVNRVIPTGLVVLLEDLHWADPDTVMLVEYLADNLAGTPVLLILTMRDSPDTAALELARRQRGRPGIIYLGLDRLDHDEMAAMVRACQPDVADDVMSRIQQTSDGIPLLVEELLASPGLPEDFAATVMARLATLSAEEQRVIEAAAVLGRQFDWELLPAMTGQSHEAVAEALAVGVESLLLISQGPELRFRHALTRDAVLDTLIPPDQRRLATSGLATLRSTHPDLEGGRRELAVDLALRAGDRHGAGVLLAESGRQSLSFGALATAADALRRAADLLTAAPGQADAELALIEALALAGCVEEAAAVGGRLITRLGSEPTTADVRVEAHLCLAHAAIAASRWQMARHHLGEARQLLGNESTPSVISRTAVLEADVAMAADDYDRARSLAEQILDAEGVQPDIRCHAFEILGRSHRSVDLPAARAAFESALVTAEAADLPLWRLRALHELGTIDMFDHAGVDRLLQARYAAEQMGAMSTAGILDLQLAAAFTCRWELGACDTHATSAIAIAERLGLDQVRAKALAMLTGSAGMRADLSETERYAAATVAAASEDRMLEGFCWGTRGMALMLAGDAESAIEPWDRGMAILAKLPHAEPAALRALWPVVLAARGDRRAPSAVDDARRLQVAAFHLNRAMIGYAEAILAGRQGDVQRARELLALADTGWTNCQAWADLTRLLAAPAAAADGWAEVRPWLTGAAVRFAEIGLPALSRRCEDLLVEATPNPWSAFGISAREADVLRLVSEGLSNKEVAAQLHLSPRTVEKHVESLLRKSGARTRIQLVTRLVRTARPALEPRSPTDIT